MEFAYLFGALYFVLAWTALFSLLPNERKLIFLSSFACGPAGPISEYWHRADYWRPHLILAIKIGHWTFGLEDYLFAFAFGGICASVFDLLIKRFCKAEEIRFGSKGFLKLFCVVMLSLALMAALIGLFHMNSIRAITVSFLLFAGIVFYRRPAFILPGLAAALLMAAFMWVFYRGFFLKLYPGAIGQFWLNGGLSGIALAGVPIEELIWAGSAALFIGPAARYCLYFPESP